MDYKSTYSSGDETEFQCDCGAHLKVIITQQDGHNEQESYNCPHCQKEYSVRASMTPRVIVLGKESSDS